MDARMTGPHLPSTVQTPARGSFPFFSLKKNCKRKTVSLAGNIGSGVQWCRDHFTGSSFQPLLHHSLGLPRWVQTSSVQHREVLETLGFDYTWKLELISKVVFGQISIDLPYVLLRYPRIPNETPLHLFHLIIIQKSTGLELSGKGLHHTDESENKRKLIQLKRDPSVSIIVSPTTRARPLNLFWVGVDSNWNCLHFRTCTTIPGIGFRLRVN